MAARPFCTPQEITSACFQILSDLLLATLREANNHRDFRCAKALLSATSAFHRRDPVTGACEPLQLRVTMHEIFQNVKFWEDMIYESCAADRQLLYKDYDIPQGVSAS